MNTECMAVKLISSTQSKALVERPHLSANMSLAHSRTLVISFFLSLFLFDLSFFHTSGSIGRDVVAEDVLVQFGSAVTATVNRVLGVC